MTTMQVNFVFRKTEKTLTIFKLLILKGFFLFGLLLVTGFYQFHFKKVDPYHDLISGFRMLWIFITSQQRCLNDLCNGTVCLPGHTSWIYFSQSLQKFWRRKVEIKCPSDFNAVSRHCICSFLCYEFGVVVSTSLNTYISVLTLI